MKIGRVDEPDLQFADGTHPDVRAGIANYGALDRGAPTVPSPIRVGLVGTDGTVKSFSEWIERCADGVISTEQRLRDLRPDFPGMGATNFGTTLALASATDRCIASRELAKLIAEPDALSRIVDCFLAHARDLAQRGSMNVLVVAPPSEVFELGRSRVHPDDPLDEGSEAGPPRYISCFHDRFKALALELGVPCQIIRPDTYGGKGAKRQSLQDEATRAWNLHTALFYKAGAVPWRLLRDSASLSTCYVGVSFFQTLDGQRVLASVAQVFDERGEGVIVQGANARIDKDDRSPHLGDEDMHKLVADALAAYRREHRNHPARLVVHKTSYFDAAESAGARASADDAQLDVLDLISVRRSFVRIFRNGTYPVLRGTHLIFDDCAGTIHLHGSVPQFRTYPGMYVPTSLEFKRAYGDAQPAEIVKELLDLSKLNFNNTQFHGGEPITVRAARRVGDILKHVPHGRQVQSRFRFFT